MIGRRTFLVDARRLIHPDDNSTNILVLFEDVTERQRHEIEQNFIISESRHRMKNLFAVVRAIAMQTGTEDRTADEYRDALLGRVEVALRAQELVAGNGTTDLADLLKNSVGEIGTDRLLFEGPAVQLSSSKVLPIGMIIHEMTTNATKYGALSVPEGEIHVRWSLETGPSDRTYLNWEWREKNGPAVTAPTRKGYGTELIEGSAAHLGGKAELIYGADGLGATIKLPM
ncbi:sensor histidine kinase [Rhizobium leucaenae]|uniref:histidine kinase n=1 Tax=Rhizobium leucaenae TaxID=29450 RepID=A0A7W6ZUQ5_9HYPH|nr:two-component sensor histidine kinase [Rhizobium leucaenae]